MKLTPSTLWRSLLAAILMAGSVWSQSVDRAVAEARQKAESGDLMNAGRILEDAVAANPENAQVHQALGTLLASAGNREGAITHLKKAAALNPQSVSIMLALGEAYETFGDLASAQEVL